MSRSLVAYVLPENKRNELDLAFRLSFLEGVAREPPGRWAGNPRMGAGLARKWFEVQEVPMDQDWFQILPKAPWVLELQRRVRGMAQRFSKPLLAIGWEADDIFNQIVSGTNSTEGKRQYQVFYSFGLSRTSPQEVSKEDPNDASEVIGKGLTKAVGQVIDDFVRKPANRPQWNNITMMGPGDMTLDNPKSDHLMETHGILPTSRSPEALLVDLLGDQMGAGRAIRQLAQSEINKLTKNPENRFVLERFFDLMADPEYNVRDPNAGKDKRPKKDKMWQMMNRIYERIQRDMLEKFDPKGEKTPEERKKLITRIYSILGPAGRGGKGTPKNVALILDGIRSHPAVKALIDRFEEESELMSLRTANLVLRYKFAKLKDSLGLLGAMIFTRGS